MNINKESVAYFLAGLGMLVVVFVPQLFMGWAYSNGDPLLAFYPALSFYAHQLASHGSFLWSSSILTGFPTYLDLVGGFYSPITRFVFTHFSVVTAYNLAIFSGTAMLFLFSYLYARQIKISRVGSLLAAAVYSFGFQMAPWSNNITVVNAMFVLPMLLLCLEEVREKRYWWILLGGIMAGYALISGQPQWVILGFFGAGLYALFLIWPDIRKLKISRLSLILAGSLIIVAVLAFALSAFQILPSQKIASYSTRVGGISFSAAQVSAQTPFDWLGYLLPDLQIKYLNTQEPTLYIGVLPLLFALLSLSSFKRDTRVKIFTALFLFGIIAALKFSPIFWIIHKLPVFNYFRGSNRWMYIGNLGLAILSGLGLDLAVSEGLSKASDRIRNVLKIFICFSAAIIVSLNIAFFFWSEKLLGFLYKYFDVHYYAATTHLPLGHYHNSIKSLVYDTFWNVSLLNGRLLLALAFIVIGYLFLRFTKRSKRVSPLAAVLVVAVSFLNLAVLHLNYYQIIPRALVENVPELATFILNENFQTDVFRYFTIMSGPAESEILESPHVGAVNTGDRIQFERGMLVVNVGMQYGVDTIDGYNNLIPKRNAQILAILGSERTTVSGLADKKENIQDKLAEVSSRLPLLSMMNVKYLVSAYPLPSSPRLSLVHTAYVTRFKIPIYLYENKAVLPRVYLAKSVTDISSNDETAFTAVTNPTNDFSKTTYLECQDCEANTVSAKDSLSIIKYTDGLLVTKVSTQNGHWLVFSESNLPGWAITIDGQPTKAVTANYLFQAVYVPKGEHEVRWEYKGI